MLRRSSLRANNRSLLSIIHQFIRFPLLKRPSFINIPFWVAWWVCFFNESVALVTGVTASNRFPLSIVHLSLRTQRTSTFSSGDAVDDRVDGALSLLRAIKLIIGLDFAVTLSSPDSFLCSFRHHFKTIGGTEMANVKQTQKMIPLVTCEISLG